RGTTTSTCTRSGPIRPVSSTSTSARCFRDCADVTRGSPVPRFRWLDVWVHTRCSHIMRSDQHMGVFEEAKGKVKEAVADVTDNPDLKREGQAQKDKGAAEREATEARAKEKTHDAKATSHEAEQESAEAAKRGARPRARAMS